MLYIYLLASSNNIYSSVLINESLISSIELIIGIEAAVNVMIIRINSMSRRESKDGPTNIHS